MRTYVSDGESLDGGFFTVRSRSGDPTTEDLHARTSQPKVRKKSVHTRTLGCVRRGERKAGAGKGWLVTSFLWLRTLRSKYLIRSLDAVQVLQQCTAICTFFEKIQKYKIQEQSIPGII